MMTMMLCGQMKKMVTKMNVSDVIYKNKNDLTTMAVINEIKKWGRSP